METPNLIPTSIMGDLPDVVRHELLKLPPQKQKGFVEEYRRKSKSLAPAYILWLLLGWHYIYFGKWGMQILFWITAGGLVFWWIVDAFRIPSMKRNYNKDVAIDVLRNLKAISS